jgi:hypothetical protein
MAKRMRTTRVHPISNTSKIQSNVWKKRLYNVRYTKNVLGMQGLSFLQPNALARHSGGARSSFAFLLNQVRRHALQRTLTMV